MSLRDRLAEAFDELLADAGAPRAELLGLLEDIGRLNGGLLAPKSDDEEKHFVARVQHAMERQAIYYANVLGGRRNADFISAGYAKDLVEDGRDVEDNSVPLSAFVRLSDPDSVALVESPTAATYRERFLGRGITLAPERRGDTVLDELIAIRDRLKSHAVGELTPVRHANAFMLEDFRALRETAEAQVVGFEPASRDRVAVLYNDTYFDALLESLAEAERYVSILMFYFPYDGRRTRAVTTQVFNALVAAQERGVAVHVVLDRDRKDQKYGTRDINANTVRALKRNGIEARFDSREHVTHSKIVTIDDRVSYVGAHNLSNSSSYLYEEVSLLIRSTKVARYYRKFIAEAT